MKVGGADHRSSRGRHSTYGRQRRPLDCPGGGGSSPVPGEGSWNRATPGRCSGGGGGPGGTCETDAVAALMPGTEQQAALSRGGSSDDDDDDDFHTVAGDLATEMDEPPEVDPERTLVSAIVSLERSISSQCQLISKRLSKEKWSHKTAAEVVRAPVIGAALPKAATRTERVNSLAR